MNSTRRQFLQTSAAAAMAAALRGPRAARADELPSAEEKRLIVDTHQHLWDLSWQKLPWLAGAPEVLRQNYRTKEYLKAVRGLDVKCVYMEVDVAPEQHAAEAEHVVKLARSDDHPTVAAVIGGRPASADFAAYLDRFKDSPEVKGVRQVLHGDATKAGYCLRDEFVRGVRMLGERGLRFDLCLRPTELRDGLRLTELCPGTRFVLDHCGNADPTAFRAGPADAATGHEVEPWKRDIAALAERPNVICKVSGIVARAPKDWTADDLAPIVNHCLDAFGPDRVVFGGDWPVCLLGADLRAWIGALSDIVSHRPAEQQKKLWSENAVRWYDL